MTVDGRLYDSTTPEDPLLDNSVLMKIQILNPAKTCILYEEEQTVSTLSSNGYFNVRVGSPTAGAESLKRTTATIDVGNSMMEVFQNQNASVAGKTSGGAGCGYTPAAGDTRYFRFVVTPSTTGVTSTLSPDMQIDSVPQSLVAETLQGMTPSNFVQTNTDVTQAKVNTLFGASYTTLSGLLAGSSSLYLQNTTNGTVIPNRATNPVAPTAGQIWYDSDDFVLRYYDGTSVLTLGTSGGDPTKLPLAGGTMAGAIGMGSNDITDIGHMTQAAQRTFRFGVYTTIQQGTLIATPLVAGHEGTVWYNTTTNKLMFWDGTAEFAVSPVDSVFGRTGAVVAAASDYDANQIDNIPAGAISATEVQAAINELDTEKVAKAGDSMGGALTFNTQNQARFADSAGGEYAAIQAPTTIGTNYVLTLPDTAGTNGQVLSTNGSGVLSWIAIPSAPVTTVFGRSGAVVAAVSDYDSNQIDNTPAGAISATEVQSAINELDTEKVAKAGDTMTGALNIDNEQELRLSEADGSGANYVAFKALTTMGANYTLTLPPDDGNSGQYLQTDGNGVLAWVTPAGVGETNTASNQGAGGVGVFKQKTTFDLEFRNINAASNKISVALDAGNNEIDINVNEANLAITTRAINTAAGSGLSGGGDLSADRSLSVNINGTTAETVAAANDEILVYDTSATALRKMARSDFLTGYLTAEADTLATVTGRGASTATTITLNTQAQARFADSAGGEYAAIQAPTTIAANYVLTLPDTAGTNGQVLSTNGSGVLSWIAIPSAPVSTVFGRSGAVVAAASDYDANQIDNTAAGNIAATDVQAALNELDTEKVAKAGDSMTGSLTMNAQNEVRYADSDSSNYVAVRSPATVASNVTLTLPATAGLSGQYLQTDGAGVLSWVTPSGAGETNTASNQGVGGVGLYDAKSTFDLQFRNINAASNKVTVALDAGNKEVDINVNEANFALGTIPNTAAGNIAATNAQTAINELDTEKVAKAGDSMTGALTLSAQTQARFADSAGGEYAAIQAPATIGANYVLTLPDTAGSASQVLTTNGSGVLSWTTLSATGDFLANGSIPMTGQLRAVAGTNAAPGYTFSGDLDTGLFNPYDGAIRMTFNGTGSFTFDANGMSSVNGGIYIRPNNGNASFPSYSFGGDDDTGTFLPSANTMGFSTAGVERFRIDSSGNVGIGTTAPGTTLDVAGAITSRPYGTATGEAGQLIMRELAAGGTDTVAIRAPDAIGISYALTLPGTAGSANQVLTTNGSGVLSWTAPSATPGADSLNFTDFADALVLDASTDISAAGTNALSITNTGTGNSFVVNDETSDTTPFVIGPDGNVGIGAQPTAGAGLFVEENIATNSSLVVDGALAISRSGSSLLVGSDTNWDSISLSPDGAPVLTALDNGRVGIGTTVPGTIIDAAGAITSRPNGTGTGQTGQLIMRELAAGGTDTVAIRAPDAITTSYALTLPGTAGSASQVLTTNGSGVLSWTTPSATAALSSLTAASATNTIANTNYAQVWNWNTLTTQTAMSLSTNSGTTGTLLNLTNTFDSATSTGNVLRIASTGTNNAAEPLLIVNGGTGPTLRVNDNGSDSDLSPFLIDASGSVGIGVVVPGTILDVAGAITSRPSGTGTGQTGQIIMRELASGGLNTFTIRAPDGLNANRVLTLPDSDGSNGQVLSTNGSGALSWIPTPAGSLSGLTAATGTNTIANADFAQVWNWDTLTTQSAMSLGTTSGTTGTLLNLANTFNSATSTGNVLKVSTTGASNAAVPLMVTNAGTGNSFRVNDDGTDTDTSPFVVDATGNLGIGTTVPSEKLEVNGNILLSSDVISPMKLRFSPTDSGTNYNNTVEERKFQLATGPFGDGSFAYNFSWRNNNDTQRIMAATFHKNGDVLFPSGNIGAGTLSPGTRLDVAGAITSRPNGTGTGQTGQLIMRELAAGGTDTVAIRAPDAIGTSYSLTLPGTAGSASQVLTTNGSGVLSWTTPSGSSALSGLTAASATNTIADTNYAQVWNWDTLTTQTAMSMGTTSGTTGTLLNLTNSFNSATSTGNVLKVSATGASNAAVPLMVTNAGTGGSFRVNDDGTDTDTTPFVIDATGQIGIGTTAPFGLLDLSTGVAGASPVATFNDADVAHGMTAIGANTNTVGAIGTLSNTAGGLLINGYSDDANTSGIQINAFIGSASPTAGTPGILLMGMKKNGTTVQNLASGDTLLKVQNGDNVTVGFNILGSGNVGIGTTGPARLLHVNGPMRVAASALPATGLAAGEIAVDSGDGNKLKWYDGSAWQAAGGSGGGGYAGTVDITAASYSITSGQNGIYFTFNHSAAGTINLPALSGLSDGFQVTILRQVAQALTLSPNGADTFPSGITTIEMQGQNMASVTLTKLGSKWNLTNTTDDCIKGQACWGAGNLYVGTLNGKQYFTTPGGCTDSGTPTCAGGTDTVTKAWATAAPESNTDLPINENDDGKTQSATLATYITANAAKYCENMTYAGYSDWYLPANSELNMLYQSRGNITGFVYTTAYWSSTERSATSAWFFNFDLGNLSNVNKTNILYIRCVRRF